MHSFDMIPFPFSDRVEHVLTTHFLVREFFLCCNYFNQNDSIDSGSILVSIQFGSHFSIRSKHFIGLTDMQNDFRIFLILNKVPLYLTIRSENFIGFRHNQTLFGREINHEHILLISFSTYLWLR